MIRAVGSVPSFKGMFKITGVTPEHREKLDAYFEEKKGNSLDYYYHHKDRDTAYITTTETASRRDGAILTKLTEMFNKYCRVKITYDSSINKIDDNYTRFDHDPPMRIYGSRDDY